MKILKLNYLEIFNYHIIFSDQQKDNIVNCFIKLHYLFDFRNVQRIAKYGRIYKRHIEEKLYDYDKLITQSYKYKQRVTTLKIVLKELASEL